MKYELIKNDKLSTAILDILVDCGYLRQFEEPVLPRPVATFRNFSGLDTQGSTVSATIGQWSDTNPKSDNPYIGNHLPIDSNIDKICRDILGVVEEKKQWDKPLKEAVKNHGHDEVLEGFYYWAVDWSGGFMGKKPVTMFLKNVDNNLVSKKPLVTNPALDRVVQNVAYISDNKIIFTGEYRIKLAAVIREHGEEDVITAFKNFFQDVDDRGIPWAARDFLQRASIMIQTTKMKTQAEDRAKQLLQSSYEAAQKSVEADVEEEDEL